MSAKPPDLPPGRYDFAFRDPYWWRTAVIDGDVQVWRRVKQSFVLDALQDYQLRHPGRLVATFPDLLSDIRHAQFDLEFQEKAVRTAMERSR